MKLNLQNLESLVGSRLDAVQISDMFDATDIVYPQKDEYATVDEDYKMCVADKDGIGTIWYAMTRAGNKFITEVAYEGGI